ncbi:hypothetical protein SKTS_33050 [Sulfurimicrobium lacus]|uniref:Uncharacterized protein n=1 Tax=Sulfurimicrobium lacus TaxID=2715678 RepID=A0A6F8VI83_9PROT|nr:hypothetical protein [Sulfurimicrobium lacus]BCB28419.1 hypothetical protein SKTS_33050 [Sulfurimicrobium lacus]
MIKFSTQPSTARERGNVIRIANRPTVFHPEFVARLKESNQALRLLRAIGCKVISLRVSLAPGAQTEIVVNRNPQMRLAHCPSVHVTHGRTA